MKGKRIVIFIFFIAFFGCKSSKRVVSSKEINTKLDSKEIIKLHKAQTSKFKTLQSRVKIVYTQESKSQTHTVSMRLQKNETIWLSATLGIVRAMITPNRVQFYNKLDNTYFDGDFSLINNALGTELDFQKIQNLLLGEALLEINDDDYKVEISEKSYILSPRYQREELEVFLLLNAAHFKMNSQQFAQPLEKRFLQIDYNVYQNVEQQILPENITIIALDKNKETQVNMELKSVSLNDELRFPFRIPSGFSEIVLE